MTRRLQPWELLETHHLARQQRVSSVVASLASLVLTGVGVGAFIAHSGMASRYGIALPCWVGALVAANRASVASREAKKWGDRLDGIEQISEESAYQDLFNALKVTEVAYKGLEAETQSTPYNWQDAAEEGVGFIIAGNSGSGKTSVATWLIGLLTQEEPAQVIVLDPHWNSIWKEHELFTIGQIEAIEAYIRGLLKELDERCDRVGRGEPVGEPWIAVADEIGSYLHRFSDPKLVLDALQRLGSEGRKFGITLVAINQSRDVRDLGITEGMRANYFIINLGAAARIEARRLGKDMMEQLKGAAYPCLVTGSIEPQIAIHPTHGQYKLFKKKGNKPLGLLPIHQIQPSQSTCLPGEGEMLEIEPLSISKYAETKEELEPVADCIEKEIGATVGAVSNEESFERNQNILALAKYIKGKGEISVRDVKRSWGANKGFSPDDVNDFLIALMAHEKIESHVPVGKRGEWVRWLE